MEARPRPQDPRRPARRPRRRASWRRGRGSARRGSRSQRCRTRSSWATVPDSTARRRPLRIDTTGSARGARSPVARTPRRPPHAAAPGSTLETATIGELSPTAIRPRRRATRPAAAPINWARASSSHVAVSAGAAAVAASRPCECPTMATGACSVGSRPCIRSARSAATWVRKTPGMEIAADRSTCSRRRSRLGSTPRRRALPRASRRSGRIRTDGPPAVAPRPVPAGPRPG